jgi:hypothetical protein
MSGNSLNAAFTISFSGRTEGVSGKQPLKKMNTVTHIYLTSTNRKLRVNLAWPTYSHVHSQCFSDAEIQGVKCDFGSLVPLVECDQGHHEL